MDDLGEDQNEIDVDNNDFSDSDYLDIVSDGTRKDKHLTLGFIAQDVEETLEEFGYATDDYDRLFLNEKNPYKMRLRMPEIIPVLTKAIQELSAKNKKLKERLTELES